MRKGFLIGLFGLLSASLAFGAITTDQKYLMNNYMGPVAAKVQLGTLIEGAESLTSFTLASGNILVGNASNVSASVAMSGDATISNAGAVSLAADSVAAAEIATDGVGSDEIAADAVGTSEIATDGVGSDEIAADAVGASEIATDAVEAAEIAADAVTASEIATDAVDSDEIAAGAVGTSEIATDGVGSDEIAADAVGSSEIATDAVDSAEIAADAVDSAEIAAGAVDEAHLSGQAVDGLHPKRIARATYDFSEHGGVVGAIGLGVSLPDDAIIQRSFFQVTSQFASAGGNATIAFHCETADNIFAAADIDADVAGTIKEGVSTGTAANMKVITSSCAITATIAVENLTSGKAVIWVEYVVTE